MVTVAEEDESIGIISAYSLQGSKVINDGLPYLKRTFNGRDVCRKSLLLDGKQIFGSPTTILVRSDIVRARDPFFNEQALFEDTDACYEILQRWNFGFAYEVLTFIRIENESVSTKVSAFDPAWFLAKFIRINNYGKVYLSHGEYQERLRVVKEAYFKYLAHNVFCKRGREFWEYHTKGLATIGYDLKLSKLSKYVVWELAHILLNPMSTVGRLVHRLRLCL
jgi:hypothetical protein